MIKNAIIKISDDEYYDDAQLLVRSFFVDADIIREGGKSSDVEVFKEGSSHFEVKSENTIHIDADRYVPVEIEASGTRGEKHDFFKRNLYTELVHITGKTLPWGFLTGVRPAKRATEMIKRGGMISPQKVKDEFSKKYMTSPEKAKLALEVALNERRVLSEKGICAEPVDYNGFSVYVGIPFCPSTCLYCSFPSAPITSCGEELVEAYIESLLTEIKIGREIYERHLKEKGLQYIPLKPSSVYIGGGTPTSLTPGQLERILRCLKESFAMGDDIEFCAEAGRPDSIDNEKLYTLKENGVNRISVNPQTMNQKTLDILGRAHTTEDVYRAFELARKTGFNNINTDIILGLPEEGEAEVEKTVNEIKILSPDSLTVHSLAIKRASRLKINARDYSDMSRENSEKLIAMTSQLARDMDMLPYYMYRQQNMAGNFENTGYAKPGKESVYNIVIMEEVQDILAFGAGASSKFLMGNNRFERAVNVKDIRNYTDRTDEMIARKGLLLSGK